MSAHLPKITVLSPIVTRVLGCNPGKFTLQGTNTYIIGSGKRRILLDTGDGTSEYASLISQFLKEKNVEISIVLLSHWHPDHIGGLNQVMHISKELSHPLPTVYKCFNDDKDAFNWEITDLEDGQKFDVEGASLTGYFTPGHADDHFVFWLEQERAIFTADNVLGEGTTVFNDLTVYMNSLKRMLSFGAEHSSGDGSSVVEHLYPGHGPVIQNGVAKINEYISHRMEREKEILSKVRNTSQVELSVGDITDQLYKELPPNLRSSAERGVSLHLKKLAKENQLIETDSGNWRVANAKL